MPANPSPDRPVITAADFAEIRWYGNWIWCDPPPPPRFMPGMESAGPDRPEVHALFRKTFTLAQVPGACAGAHHRRFALPALCQRAGSVPRSDPQPAAPHVLRPVRPGAVPENRRECPGRLCQILWLTQILLDARSAHHGPGENRGNGLRSADRRRRVRRQLAGLR